MSRPERSRPTRIASRVGRRVSPTAAASTWSVTGGHYGVVGWHQTGYAVSGSACHDNGFNSVADEREVELDPAPFALPAADERLVCRIISTDGTWHRPFTTLDLAALHRCSSPRKSSTNRTGSGTRGCLSIWKAHRTSPSASGSATWFPVLPQPRWQRRSAKHSCSRTLVRRSSRPSADLGEARRLGARRRQRPVRVSAGQRWPMMMAGSNGLGDSAPVGHDVAVYFQIRVDVRERMGKQAASPAAPVVRIDGGRATSLPTSARGSAALFNLRRKR